MKIRIEGNTDEAFDLDGSNLTEYKQYCAGILSNFHPSQSEAKTR